MANEKIQKEEYIKYLEQQVAELRKAMYDTSVQMVFTRMNALQRCLEMPKGTFSDEFVAMCTKEIENTLTIPAEAVEQTKKMLYGNTKE